MASAQSCWPAGVVLWARSPSTVIEPAGLRRPMHRRATAEWSCDSSTTTCPNVNGVPLSSELASSTRNWSATVQARRLPRPPAEPKCSTSNWSTRRIGWAVGQAFVIAARSAGAFSHTSSRPYLRSMSRCTMPFTESRRLLTGPRASSASYSHWANSSGVTVMVRAPTGTRRSSIGTVTCRVAAASRAASISGDPFARRRSSPSTPVISTFGTHRSSAVRCCTLRSPSDGSTLPM